MSEVRVTDKLRIGMDLFQWRCQRLRLLQEAFDSPVNVSAGGAPKNLYAWLELCGIPPQHVDSFVLHMRLLVQDNDGYSIRALAELIEEELPEDFAPRAEFERAREAFAKAYSSDTAKTQDGVTVTVERLFNVVMYGGFAHNNRGKLADFARMYSPQVFGVLDAVEIKKALCLLLRAVLEIDGAVAELLRATENTRDVADGPAAL